MPVLVWEGIAWGGMRGGQQWPCPGAPAEGRRQLLRHLAEPEPTGGQLYANVPADCEVALIIQYQGHLLANSEEECHDPTSKLTWVVQEVIESLKSPCSRLR